MNAVCFVTSTYAADEAQFALLRKSIECSRLKDTHHRFVVHTEDQPIFKAYAGAFAECWSTAQVLPPGLETRRLDAARRARRIGPRATTWLGSSARRIGWPTWPHYTGWHVQQISKLVLAAMGDEEYAVVIDSDTLVTPQAHFDDLAAGGTLVCLSDRVESHQVKGKVKHWNESALALFKVNARTGSEQHTAERYFDTPFVLHVPTLRAMFAWLEDAYQAPWWQTMLNQAPRRWSEFECYRTFLNHHAKSDRRIVFKRPVNHRYLFESSDHALVVQSVDEWLNDKAVHYITLHSHSAGRTKTKPTDLEAIARRLGGVR